MYLIFRVHELRYLWLNSVFVVTFTVTTFMGGVVTFMGVCDTYGKLLDTYGSFVIFMGVVTFMRLTLYNLRPGLFRDVLLKKLLETSI